MAGTNDAVMMVEAGANEVPEDVMLDAIMFGHEEIKRIVALQEEMRAAVGKPKMDVPLAEPDPEVAEWVRQPRRWSELDQAVRSADKQAAKRRCGSCKEKLVEAVRGGAGRGGGRAPT